MISNLASKDKQHPQERYAYAITTGTFAGEIIIFVNTKNGIHQFLSVPLMTNRDIPGDKFKIGLESNIVEVVEKLPHDVYKVAVAQHKKNIASV